MEQKNFDEQMMREAISLAKAAEEIDEVPVGAVAVRDGKIIARAYNTRERDKNALCHAEIKAINEACNALGGWRLVGCTLYVTLEPCPMCAGAIINARIERVVFGAYDKKAGSCGSVTNLFELPYNHKPELIGGVLEEECSLALTEFFRDLRTSKQSLK